MAAALLRGGRRTPGDWGLWVVFGYGLAPIIALLVYMVVASYLAVNWCRWVPPKVRLLQLVVGMMAYLNLVLICTVMVMGLLVKLMLASG